ncbi:MAG TPA: tetratricopeptide repeat protein [Novosphingobium sp.]|nr:tetratricopeptide repeat protein [Novosphingobium sp.]
MKSPFPHHQAARPVVRNVVCTALAAALIAGVASVSLEPAEAASTASAVVGKKVAKIILKAEQAVRKAPQSVAARTTLAQAYLTSGRFESAVTTFDDAMRLGDTSPRTALSLALAQIGAGDKRAAVATLDAWGDTIPAGDLGLALALAGETGRGVTMLSDALRAGEDTPKLRQNLAYAYALDGRWGEAKVMAAQDLPADQVDTRIAEWAMQGKPEDYRARVAAMLGAPMVSDPGQPQQLALNANPAKAPAPVAASAPVAKTAELAPIEQGGSFWLAEAPRPEPVVETVAVPAPQPAYNPVPEAVRAVAPVAAPRTAPKAAPKTAKASAAAPAKPAAARAPEMSFGTHMVQLGSFSTEANARRAWKIFTARDPKLKNYKMAITPAIVRGKQYWRVAASGFDGGSARSMCSTVKSRGGACFAYAVARPLPGVVSGRALAKAASAARLAQR